jgi:peroxiredoxin Q/BCP
MGREYMGIQRSTFLIDPEGHIVQEFPKVVPKKHAHQIIEALQQHQNLASPA